MNRKEDIMFDKIRKLKIKFINFKNENDKKKRYNKLVNFIKSKWIPERKLMLSAERKYFLAVSE